MKRTTVLMFATAFSIAAFAESEFGPWRFSAGPAWRSRVKATLSGSVPVSSVGASHTVTYDKDITGTLSQLDEIGKQFNVTFVISVSLDKEEVPEAFHDKVIVAL